MDAQLAAGHDGVWNRIHRAARHGVVQAYWRRTRVARFCLASGSDRALGNGGTRRNIQERSAIPASVLRTDRNAHAARHDWSDLSGRGRISEVVLAGPG